ncbi:MAG: heavy metal-associated domain-containing protein [Longimicrobiales bacterium]|nr:heavy metal-associated domain-containing protein [Longimicrobiales bacterium]
MQHVTECHVDPIAARASAVDRRSAAVLYLALAEVECPNCANRVRNALLMAPGVVDVEVDLAGALATVWYNGGEAGVKDLLDAVAEAGRGTHHRYLAVPVVFRWPRT